MENVEVIMLSVNADGGVDRARALIVIKTANSWRDISKIGEVMLLWVIPLDSTDRGDVGLRK